ncbi:DUF4358 domain-containing protein [Ruminococcus sp.]|uniref:DUF4358 domain-containing protein n=1 Tax=Ruminococcus sp. TaxID=41978 RepID=UPI00388EE070
MKRFIGAMALITVCALLFCACGSTAKPLSEIFSGIKTTYHVTDLVEFSDASDLNRFYGIKAEDVKEFAGGINNSGVDMEEIVMVLATDDDAAKRIATSLNNRRDSKLNETKNYNPEQYAIVEKSSVGTDGKYVSLFISRNSTEMETAFKKGIGLAS